MEVHMDANQLAQVIVALTGAQAPQPTLGVAGSMIGKFTYARPMSSRKAASLLDFRRENRRLRRPAPLKGY